ncbi:MAG TPA: hypothetical protein VHF05_01100 [Candidatus Paceibacterota bacterium]|jgi:hypothetical protein|nr:hypothetical protein [Candidatus Paceibacterota bacterium]
MSLQEMHDEHAQYWRDKDGIKFGLASMRWHGWGSPVGLGLFLLSIGGFLLLLHFAGLIGG